MVSLPLLTTDTQGQFAQCAAGAFDSSWRQIGANLNAAGTQGMVVRLGWEANIGSDSHPWGVDTPDQVPGFVQCWRHAAAQLKSTAPGVLLEWTSSKKTSNTSINVLDMNPGDDVVDIWGVHYYDSGPEKSTQALWDKYYTMTFNGGPWGLGSWLAAAQQHGKKLAVSEYAVWQQDGQTAAQADDPVYVDNMYRFFKANAASIAYESYFNSMPDQHTLCNADGTPTAYPNSATTYQRRLEARPVGRRRGPPLRWPAAPQRSSGSGSIVVAVRLGLDDRDRVAAVQPAREVDVAAAGGAERAEALLARPAADGTAGDGPGGTGLLARHRTQPSIA